MIRLFTSLTVLLFSALSVNAQFDGPRYFWDIPGFYLTTPNVSQAAEQAGVGLETVFNVAAHWGTVRAGGGSTFTIDATSSDIPGSFLATPYFLLEGAAGMYRTNTNRCAKSNRGAFTAMGVVGMRYDIDTRDVKSASDVEQYGFNFGLGVELGYFYIRDVFRNTEVVLRGTYYPTPNTFALNLGMKFFLNVREFGRY